MLMLMVMVRKSFLVDGKQSTQHLYIPSMSSRSCLLSDGITRAILQVGPQIKAPLPSAPILLLGMQANGSSHVVNGKKSACQCRRCRRHGFDPWVRKIPWRKQWLPTPVFLPGESHGQRSLVDYSPWVRKELDRTEHMCMQALRSLPRPPGPSDLLYSSNFQLYWFVL